MNTVETRRIYRDGSFQFLWKTYQAIGFPDNEPFTRVTVLQDKEGQIAGVLRGDRMYQVVERPPAPLIDGTAAEVQRLRALNRALRGQNLRLKRQMASVRKALDLALLDTEGGE